MTEFTCRVTTHGKQQLELQLVCPLALHRRRAAYRISLYMLFPPQLRMHTSRYSAQQFLRDTTSYTRFTTPEMSLRMLLDPQNEKSPFFRIRRSIQRAGMAGDLDVDSMVLELKSLVNIYHRQLKEVVRRLEGNMESMGVAAELVALGEDMVRDLAGVLAVLRDEIRPRLLEASMPVRLRRSLEWADESMSLSTEKFYFRLHRLGRLRPDLSDLVARSAPLLASESEYRKMRGYSSLVDPDNADQNHTFIHQESMLKKWAEKTYYMTQENTRSSQHVATLLMAVAAMIAMVFAVMVTFFAGNYFAQNSLPFALMLVVAYGFKDRIKESLRSVFSHYLPRMVSDRKNRLISPTGLLVGHSSLRVAYRPANRLPVELRRLRSIAEGDVAAHQSPEDVVELHKRIVVRGAVVRKNHSRLESITEIMRFNMGAWLEYMDDPRERLWYCRDGEAKTVVADRVYPVHLLLRLEDRAAGETHLFDYTMLLNRDGVVQIRPGIRAA